MKTSPIAATPIVWYRREDYARIREVMADGHLLPPTFEAWLEKAENGFQHIQKQGGVALQIYLDPVAFSVWCAERHLNLNASSRMQYAAAAAMKIHHAKH